MQVKEQQLELDMEEQTGLKLAKEYVKSVYCQPAGTTYMQVHHEKSGLTNHRLESRLLGEKKSTSSDM